MYILNINQKCKSFIKISVSLAIVSSIPGFGSVDSQILWFIGKKDTRDTEINKTVQY